MAKSLAAPAQSAIRNPQSAIESVDPFIGTGGHGHTFPGATMPFGMVQLSPDTRPDPGDWDGCSGYHYSDPMIYGFSHTHLSGTGVSDYCDVLLQPVQRGTSFEQADFGSPFYKNTERAEPGYYRVELQKPNVLVELTASERVGFHKYHFAAKAYHGSILLDLKWRDLLLDGAIDLSRMGEGIISGHRFSRSWAKDQRLFFFLKFSKKPSGVRQNGREQAIFEFEWSSNGDHSIVVECAISAVDAAGAENNWKAETTNHDFEKAKSRAQDVWQKQLSKIEVDGGSERDRTVFYTALYHTMLAPNLFSDADGRYRGRDQQIHACQKGATMYTVFSLWDTYRALHPLMTILEPARVRDWMYTFWRQSEEGGKLPVWELAANETDCMIGNHSIPVIADAYLKGLVPDTLVEPLYRAMKRAATDGSRGLDLYEKLGYIPSDLEPESVSKTIEYSFDDWCIAQMALGMGEKTGSTEKKDDILRFLNRSANCYNLYDPATGFFRPRANATFLEPFDPREVNFNFTEANPWQYRFLQHDNDTQRDLMGGQNAYCQKLDSLFNAPAETTGRQQADITGLVGQYAQGNEPDMHVPWLYTLAYQPQKTQAIVRRILSEHFSEKPDGLPGNDDCGQMSAWVVWAMIGLYPTVPLASSGYTAGTPSFAKIAIRPGAANKAIVIEASGLSDEKRFSLWGGLHDRPFTHQQPWDFDHIVHRMKPADSLAQGMDTQLISIVEAEEVFLIPPVPFLKRSARVFTDPQTLEIADLDPAAVIHFTLDGSEPTETSARYEKPILIEKTSTLKAIAIKKGKKSKVMTAEFTRQPDRKNWSVNYTAQPDNQYTGRGPRGLIDGLRGGADFRSGGWQGFDGKELEAVIDMGEARPVSKISAGFLQDDNSWIFIPQMVFFETSLDGKNWTAATTALAKDVPNGPAEGFLQDFETRMEGGRQARFIRVKTKSYLQCPAWHKGAGNACWLFADEILVE